MRAARDWSRGSGSSIENGAGRAGSDAGSHSEVSIPLRIPDHGASPIAERAIEAEPSLDAQDLRCVVWRDGDDAVGESDRSRQRVRPSPPFIVMSARADHVEPLRPRRPLMSEVVEREHRRELRGRSRPARSPYASRSGGRHRGGSTRRTPRRRARIGGIARCCPANPARRVVGTGDFERYRAPQPNEHDRRWDVLRHGSKPVPPSPGARGGLAPHRRVPHRRSPAGGHQPQLPRDGAPRPAHLPRRRGRRPWPMARARRSRR